ncbi:hypothetical protein [Psychrobacillus sp. L3]|uniref:hypothetical protein n=1 Tax=Psychrobacillus sp. L3 TaxID=3236891 RepID=UPI0036F39248
MYKMTDTELHRYLNATTTYERLCIEQQEELEEAYENVFGTRTSWDYEQGKIYSESLNVADYAIYLVDLKGKHKNDRELWERRIRVFKRALYCLTDEEQFIYRKSPATFKDYELYHKILDTLRNYLEEIVSTIPELQEKEKKFFESASEAREVARYDAKVDKMSMLELLEDSDISSRKDILKNLNPTDSNVFEKFTRAAFAVSSKIAY